ncbi:MAG: cell division protein FtsZ [Gammaproteobacteria bacterium]|nr:cell division protein FtsZ [Gammaproteobacteria bacterium]
MAFELVEQAPQGAVIKVIGVGGGGGNAVEQMVRSNIQGVEFIAANTDSQALRVSAAPTLVQLGGTVTRGLGAGSNPEVGRQSALEDRERIKEVLAGTDMVFIAAGMGGGTGTGAAPVIAEIAREMGVLTVAVVTKPFKFELAKRTQVAESGIEELRQHVDSLIVVPNDKLLRLQKGAKLTDAFKIANAVLSGAVQGISELVTRPGLINLDFADVRTAMGQQGMAMMGTGVGSGEDRARRATEAAISSPLLEDIELNGAGGLLVNVTACEDFTMEELELIGATLSQFGIDEAQAKIGVLIDTELQDEVHVTVVATGLGRKQERPVKMAIDNPRPRAVPTLEPLKRPAIVEQQGPRMAVGSDMDYLDIPAFLRRQAD